MEKATDKQLKYLKHLGVKINTLEDLNKAQASSMIDAFQKHGKKEIKEPEVEKIEVQKFKPRVAAGTPASFYVAYAKDLVVAMLSNEKYQKLSPEELMINAIKCIKKALNEFK